MKVMISMTGEQFSNAYYPEMVVQMWGRVKHGIVKQNFHDEFDEFERKQVAKWVYKFRKWYLKDGMPENISIKPESVQLLDRIQQFFASQ